MRNDPSGATRAEIDGDIAFRSATDEALTLMATSDGLAAPASATMRPEIEAPAPGTGALWSR